MLYLYFLEFNFVLFTQSGFFFDFFFKKLSEIFLRNVLIYSSLFFGEKFFIEYLTKKIFEKNINFILYVFGNKLLYYKYFFLNLLFFILIIHILIFLIFIII